MSIKAFLGIIGVVVLAGCGIHNNPAVEARTGGHPGQGGQGTETKPAPSPIKIVEKVKALQFQKPTMEESEFLNVMELDLTAGDRALFSFSYAPTENGSFYFSLAQTRLFLGGCTKPENRSYEMRLVWQQVRGNQRVVLKEFNPNIDNFDFKKGQTYILSYALMNLKEFADCKTATLKFASFLKNYK